jgi:hypothetical protein
MLVATIIADDSPGLGRWDEDKDKRNPDFRLPRRSAPPSTCHLPSFFYSQLLAPCCFQSPNPDTYNPWSVDTDMLRIYSSISYELVLVRITDIHISEKQIPLLNCETHGSPKSIEMYNKPNMRLTSRKLPRREAIAANGAFEFLFHPSLKASLVEYMVTRSDHMPARPRN